MNHNSLSRDERLFSPVLKMETWYRGGESCDTAVTHSAYSNVYTIGYCPVGAASKEALPTAERFILAHPSNAYSEGVFVSEQELYDNDKRSHR